MTEDEFRKRRSDQDPATEGRRKILERCREEGYPPGVGAVLQFFHYEHLPRHLGKTSQLFHDLAWSFLRQAKIETHPAETIVCLRKLLEAKDAAVRATLPDATSE